ncbi:hypothetical protein CQW23_21706 [Capsicum baccatum]|uniref:RPA-interacting protein C-terminal domain-containing protein n=1 Tax=Capsicum baccatum TaxID=33114 RepID=A0A2G2VYX3_CAPBA|nr:hypothetical protein CQW23_21706 [Capsicum baccatum]
MVEMAGNEEERLQIRPSPKARNCFNNYLKWKDKLRENCYKRVREDRSRLLWKLRCTNDQPHKDLIKSSLEDIVSNEIQKFKHSYHSESFGNSKSSLAPDDTIWEYHGIHEAYQGDCEEMLLEMQRIFYEDLRIEKIKEQVSNETWEDEEDEYLARAVYEHMKLNDKDGKEVWCPICKQGELKENCHHIYCPPCGLLLNRDDEVNLEVLRNRLGEAHSDHLDQECRLKPEFCVETRFNLTALYITCRGCGMFEVVI